MVAGLILQEHTYYAFIGCVPSWFSGARGIVCRDGLLVGRLESQTFSRPRHCLVTFDVILFRDF